MHPLFWDPELSRMHLHHQIQIPNKFPVNILVTSKLHLLLFFQLITLYKMNLQAGSQLEDIQKVCYITYGFPYVAALGKVQIQLSMPM